MGNVVGIHQPNFMPWLGYFYKIWKSDVFIFLDDVQFQKTGSSYTNRVSININGKSSYLTIPIKRDSGVRNIDEVQFLNEKWKKKVVGSLQASYGKSEFFKENKDFIFELINFNSDNLAQYNINFIKQIATKLEINTTFMQSSEFDIVSTSTQRLIELIKKVEGRVYLSGSGGDNYQEHSIYTKENIELTYNKMPKFEYEQLKTEEFLMGLSIVDAIFNIGFDALKQNLFQKNKNA